MRLVLAIALLIAPAALAAPRKPAAPPVQAAAPAPAAAWRPWVDHLAALVADPALPGLTPAEVAPFFRGVVDLPAADIAQCKDVTGYMPSGSTFATAVGATVGPARLACPERRFGRVGFAVDNRSDSDTDALVTALTAKLGPPLTENVWFPKAGGQTISAVRQSWQVRDTISVVVLLEPDESQGLVGISIARGVGPSRPKAEPEDAPDSFAAMVKRMFK